MRFTKKVSKLAKFEKCSVLHFIPSCIDQARIYKEDKFVNIVKTLLSKKCMFIRFINFIFHIFSITLFSAEKSDINIHTHQNTLIELLPKSKHQQEIYLQTQHLYQRKQPQEVFCKKSCSKKFRKFHRKTSVLKSLFSKTSMLGLAQVFSCEFCEISKNIFLQDTSKQLFLVQHIQCRSCQVKSRN